MKRANCARWQVHQGESLPNESNLFMVTLDSTYAIRLNNLNNKIVISPLPYGYMLKKLEDFQYLQNGRPQKIYDKETRKALQPFMIESYVGTTELNMEKAA